MWLQPIVLCLVLLTLDICADKYESNSCVDPSTGLAGHCATVHECYMAGKDYDTNVQSQSPCDSSSNNNLVCCRDRLASNGQNNPNRRVGDISIKKCTEYSQKVTTAVGYITLSLYATERTLTSSNCNYTGVELIVGGEKSKPGEFPHMAAIGWSDYSGGYTFDCGGALISERYVLTAGHCTSLATASKSAPAIVRLGDQNLNPKIYDGAHPKEYSITRVITHPDYKPSQRYNDIALLELETNVKFSDHIRPACLWVEPDFGGHDKAFATGWGVVNSMTNKKSDELLKVSLSILNNNECNKTLNFKINRKWRQGFIESQMCAGEKRKMGDNKTEGKDTCQGDSGSPLQIASDENDCIFKVIGITSFGASVCGHFPGVYTRVSSYINWIESVVWPNE